jgi:hypothetical protein
MTVRFIFVVLALAFVNATSAETIGKASCMI